MEYIYIYIIYAMDAYKFNRIIKTILNHRVSVLTVIINVKNNISLDYNNCCILLMF
jgi:hypothetical protein